MKGGQISPQKIENSRTLRNQRFWRTSNSNSPVLKTNAKRSYNKSTKSYSCNDEHRHESNGKRDFSSIFKTADLHESTAKSPAETSEEALNLVTEHKTRKDRRARHNADQSLDNESMLSNASTISTSTLQCVDKLQISEDARHGFDDTGFDKKLSLISNEDRDIHDVNDLSSESSDSKTSDTYAGKTTCIQNMYGTDKASWLIDHSTNGSISDTSSKVSSSTLEQAIDLTIVPHDAQERTVRSETPVNILTLTPTSNNSLSLPCRHVSKPLDLSHESVDKGRSSQSPIPTILSCNATNTHNVSSCGDMKNTDRQLDGSVVEIYVQDGLCKSQSGVHQNTLIPIREVSVNMNANNSNSFVDVNNNIEEYKESAGESELDEPVKVKSSEIQSSTSFKGILKKICPESEIQHADALSSNSDLNVYRQSYYDEPNNSSSSSKQDFMRYSHYNEQQYPSEQVYPDKRNAYPHHLQNYAEHDQHYNQELPNFSQLPQAYPQPLQNYTPQSHTYPDQQVDASKVEIYAQQRITLPPQQQADDSITENTQQQIIGEENSQVTNYMQYSQYNHPMDEEQFAAEQLASELVQNYGGSNSHMISDILKRNDGQSYIHSGFERPNEIAYNQLPGSNQPMIHDVDLLNTPQQLMAVDDFKSDVQSQLGDPQAMSTPDLYQKTDEQKVSVTYNDVHLHGGSWTTNKSVVDMPTQDTSESPFPPGSLVTGRAHLLDKDGDDSFYSEDSESSCNLSKCSDLGKRPSMNMKQFQHSSNPPSDQPEYLGYRNTPIGRSPPSFNKSNPYVQPQHEITTMTFTPREMMENHLSQNYHYPKKEVVGQQISEMDYSSIYPSRDFIDRTVNESYVNKDCKRKRSDNSTPRKRSRTSKYNTDDVPKVPPQMPIIDHMFQKYPPALRRDETSGGKHKYFVVNPSEITHMSAKNLLMKYIDFLIVENEQVTEISKSSNPPVDIYVTEDMYFMDSLKFHVPFPSKKFVEWVANFYPRMNFQEMKFKGQYPRLPKDGGQLVIDHRPTQQILEDTFYYFQRIAMNGADSMQKVK